MYMSRRFTGDRRNDYTQYVLLLLASNVLGRQCLCVQAYTCGPAYYRGRRDARMLLMDQGVADCGADHTSDAVHSKPIPR